MKQSDQNGAGSPRKRVYVRVSGAQRADLIKIMLSGRLLLTEACRLTGIKYESAKSIWTVFRKQGRSVKMRSGKAKPTKGRHDTHREGNPVEHFDDACKQLEARHRLKELFTGVRKPLLSFRVALVSAQRNRMRRTQKSLDAPAGCAPLDFEEVLEQ